MAVLIRMSHVVEDEACFHSRYAEVDTLSVPVVSVVHIVNCAQCEGEYTLCGNAWTDSSLRSEGFERSGDPFKGSVKKCTCPSCLRLMNYIKGLR